MGSARLSAPVLRSSLIVLVSILAACDEPDPPPPGPDPVVTTAELTSGELIEVVPCRASHDHELNNVRTFVNRSAVEMFQRCVLVPDAHCTEPFPVGTLFVKWEYELPGCDPVDLKGYTANVKLPAGSYPEGHDWHWQRLTPRLKVVEDGAPMTCLLCHIDHCRAPYGHDLHCTLD